jgi:hypothetical protein
VSTCTRKDGLRELASYLPDGRRSCPQSRPRLNDLLRAEKIPRAWDDRLQAPESMSTIGGTRGQHDQPILGPDAAAEAHTKLFAHDRAARLPRDAGPVPPAGAGPPRTAGPARADPGRRDWILLERLRALGFPWEAIVAADTGAPTEPDFRSLVELVQHHVVPTIGRRWLPPTAGIDHRGPRHSPLRPDAAAPGTGRPDPAAAGGPAAACSGPPQPGRPRRRATPAHIAGQPVPLAPGHLDRPQARTQLTAGGPGSPLAARPHNAAGSLSSAIYLTRPLH